MWEFPIFTHAIEWIEATLVTTYNRSFGFSKDGLNYRAKRMQTSALSGRHLIIIIYPQGVAVGLCNSLGFQPVLAKSET